ncbi:class I SAM-dependent methyltransferase [Chloroflexota bacterium]
MNNIKPTNEEITITLKQVAEMFGGEGRNTILFENFGKHAFEISMIMKNCTQGGEVLDVGGGLGVNLLSLRKLDGSLKLHLVDRFDEYNEENRMGSSEAGLRLLRDSDISVVSQDFWQKPVLPYDSDTFDTAICFDVVEHLPGHPLKLLAEMRRVLKLHGHIILGGPNSIGLLKRLMLLFGRYPYTAPFESWCSDKYFSHYREYSPTEYQRLLEMSGFKEVQTIMLAEPSSRHQPRESGFTGYIIAVGIWIIYLFILISPKLRPSVYCLAEKV